MREWVTDALEAKGARFTGGGYGAGHSDIDIELEGHQYNITIRPLSSDLDRQIAEPDATNPAQSRALNTNQLLPRNKQ